MDHVVYIDAKAQEMENLLSGQKSMIIRGATGRKLPYGRVNKGDVLYFINNNAEGVVKAKGITKDVIHSDKMSREESIEFVDNHQIKLQLTPQQQKRWAGKRYIVLVEIEDVEPLEPFPIDKSEFGNMDDWLLVEEIQRVKK